MALPLIGYQTILDNATAVITATSTAAGSSLAHLYDYKSYTLWTSGVTTTPQDIDIDLGASPAAADYIAIINSTLPNEGHSIALFADSFTPPTTAIFSGVVTDRQVWYRTFTSPGSLRYWRLRLSSSGGFDVAPALGQVMIGLKTELPYYLAPSFEPYFDDVEMRGERSEGGHYLGGLARGHTHRGVITFGAGGYVRSAATALHTFIDDHAILRKPFIFIVDSDESPDDIGSARYIKVTDSGRISRTAVGDTWLSLNLAMDVEEAFMEPAT